MRKSKFVLLLCTFLAGCFMVSYAFFPGKSFAEEIPFVRVCERDSRYLELSNGDPYIPIGLNMLQARTEGGAEKQFAQMAEWIQKLSDQGGNYIRVWLSSPYWDIEHEKSGVYDEEKAKRIDTLIQTARKYNVRIKMTLEHFRYFESDRNQWAAKPIHHVSQGGPRNLSPIFLTEKKAGLNLSGN